MRVERQQKNLSLLLEQEILRFAVVGVFLLLYQISNSRLIFLSLVSVFITHGGKFNTAVAPALF
jgi:hypothetical protein